MAFGFDPSIILSATKTQEPTINDTLETLARLATSRAQQQYQQATLADLVRRQGQEQTLADIYRQNANTPEALAPALMSGGFGSQAFAAQDQANQNADRIRREQEVKAAHRKYVGQLFSGVDSPEKWAAARQLLMAEQDPMLSVYADRIPEEFDATVAGRLASLASPPTRPLSAAETEARTARADYERAKADALRRGPSEGDADKRENLRLRNDKLRKELGGSGPNKLTVIEGYEQDPGFDVKPEVAEKLRGAQADTRSMTKSVDELMGLYRQYGNKVLPSAVRARMGSLATNLQLKAKGPNMYGLGVIAGPDMELLNAVISNPTKRDATIADFFSGGRDAAESMERLRVFREQLGGNLDAALSTRGYRKKGSKRTPAPASLDSGKGAAWSDADEARLQELERLVGGGQ